MDYFWNPIAFLFDVSIILLLLCYFGSSSQYESYYPDEIPYYPIRRDSHNNVVTTGRMDSLGGVPENIERLLRTDKDTKVPLTKFKELLQCSPTEPSLDEFTGSMNLIKMMPPTRKTLELMCIWTETRCEPWLKCHEKLADYKKHISKDFGMNRHFDMFQIFRLLRITNGSLYYDWPWDRQRLDDPNPWITVMKDHYPLIEMMLSKVSDFPDSAFFMGGERPYLPWNFPFPAFSNAPSLTYTDMPWPWFESINSELQIYQKLFPTHVNPAIPQQTRTRKLTDTTSNHTTSTFDPKIHPNHHTHHNTKHNHSEDNLLLTQYETKQYLDEITHQLSWSQRKPLAAFIGSCDPYRQILFDQSRMAPEQLHTLFWIHPNCNLKPSNPLSNEKEINSQTLTQYTDVLNTTEIEAIARNTTAYPAGYVLPLLSIGSTAGGRYNPGEFKYIIVTLGSYARSTSGRLAGLLAHSGAVVLLEKTPFFYHFSARLQPWIHYVPISYSMADIVEKIQWLQAHDEFAQKIVRNAKHFARSYLRLEDYYCYAATSLETIGQIMSKTDVIEPFQPVKLYGKDGGLSGYL